MSLSLDYIRLAQRRRIRQKMCHIFGVDHQSDERRIRGTHKGKNDRQTRYYQHQNRVGYNIHWNDKQNITADETAMDIVALSETFSIEQQSWFFYWIVAANAAVVGFSFILRFSFHQRKCAEYIGTRSIEKPADKLYSTKN